MSQETWREYIERTKNDPVSPLLLKALPLAPQQGEALDIGGGGLKDTRHLLELGYEVTVIDMAEHLPEMAQELHTSKVHPIVTSFEEYAFPKERFALACAINAIPFTRPDAFPRVLADIKASLIPGGVFCGQLFGDRHQWKDNEKMTFHTEALAREAFSDMEILHFAELENDGKTKLGVPTHWHAFAIIARKK